MRFWPFLIGSGVGVCGTFLLAFATRLFDQGQTKTAVRQIWLLVGLVLGGGLSNYFIFAEIVRTEALEWYAYGFCAVFVTCGVVLLLNFLGFFRFLDKLVNRKR